MTTLSISILTISLTGSSIALGIIFSSFLRSYSINPSLKTSLFTYTLIGFAFIEIIAIISLSISFIISSV
jgi:F-type H+-transporting ATPase subunit c